jgi:hypothetical protein
MELLLVESATASALLTGASSLVSTGPETERDGGSTSARQRVQQPFQQPRYSSRPSHAERRAVDALRKDVVRCAPGDSIEEARARIEASPFGFGLVVAENGVLLGRLRRSALEQSEDGTVEQLMEVGPSTVRADVRAEELRDRHYAGWRAPGGRPAFGFVGASVAGLRCDRFTPQAE